MSRTKQFAGLAVCLGVTFAAAAVGGAASMDAKALYHQLDQPFWSPPPFVFGPVWTVLYLLMGVAAWLVWREQRQRLGQTALALYVAQLIFNALWSWLFFRWELGALAFADTVILLLLIGAVVVMFWRIKPLAGVMLVPYLLWVAFASALNYTLWQMNPNILG